MAWSRLDRREHHTLRTHVRSVTFLSKRVRQSLVWDFIRPCGLPRSREPLPPTFLFLPSSLVKDQTTFRCLRAKAIWLQPFRVSLARLSVWINESKLSYRQRRRRPRCEAYIVASPSRCQRVFLNFFEFFAAPADRLVNRARRRFPSSGKIEPKSDPRGHIRA